MEKIISFLEDTLKWSFILGSLGAFVVYVLRMLAAKSKTGQWTFSLVILVLQGFIGGIVGYFIGTFIPDDNVYKSAYIGGVGALSFPTYLFLEKYGYDIFNKIVDKIINKI